jgi:beta-galactosidase
MPGNGREIGADNLLARRVVGKGVIIYCQIDPTSLPADEKTYVRYTRWRQTRALSQILSNLGASFAQDDQMLTLLAQPERGNASADQRFPTVYLDDFRADNPYLRVPIGPVPAHDFVEKPNETPVR